MKIEYTNKQPTKNSTLADLRTGEVFRPKDSRHIFMCCDLSGESRLLSECGTDIWGYVTFIGSEPFDGDIQLFAENHDYDELIVCTNLTTGGVTLFYDGIEVEREILRKAENILEEICLTFEEHKQCDICPMHTICYERLKGVSTPHNILYHIHTHALNMEEE